MKDSINDPSEYTPFALRAVLFRKWSSYLACFFLVCVLLCTHIPAHAQRNPYAIHANIVYHFTKYINWPDDKKSGDFIIGIVGDSPLYDELKSFVSNKTAGSQKIVIKKYPANSTTWSCNILFISEEESKILKKIAATTNGAPVLLVTESEGLARKGACINFTIVDDRLKLEINKVNIEQHNLNIASELLSLGILVK
jgi:hypothetical protein